MKLLLKNDNDNNGENFYGAARKGRVFFTSTSHTDRYKGKTMEIRDNLRSCLECFDNHCREVVPTARTGNREGTVTETPRLHPVPGIVFSSTLAFITDPRYLNALA